MIKYIQLQNGEIINVDQYGPGTNDTAHVHEKRIVVTDANFRAFCEEHGPNSDISFEEYLSGVSSNKRGPILNTPDMVNHPDHYKQGGIETIDAIESWKLNYNLGNCVKYISRAGKKNPDKVIEDLEKARWYLDREISNLKKAK
jgi:Protein of unknwon function (DUF3310)